MKETDKTRDTMRMAVVFRLYLALLSTSFCSGDGQRYSPMQIKERKEDEAHRNYYGKNEELRSQYQVKTQAPNRDNRIAWVHIPKCGTSFGNVLVHYSNRSLPPMASVGDCEKCFQRKYPFDVWFHGIFWEKDANFGNHIQISQKVFDKYKGRFFGMFRNPAHRAKSAYNHFNPKQSAHDYALRIRGTAVKQLSGQSYGLRCLWEERFGCDDYENLVPDTQLAIDRLQSFAFIGITEYWDLSICLFHVLFGGDCLPIEFQNTRPGAVVSNETTHSFAGVTDLDDWALYRAALHWFFQQLRTHAVTADFCQAHCWNHIRNLDASAGLANGSSESSSSSFSTTVSDVSSSSSSRVITMPILPDIPLYST